MMQHTLFPQARNTDPVTSHLAAERHEASGRGATNRAIVLGLVRLHPRSTSRELSVMYKMDRHEVARRCSGLEHAGYIRKVLEPGKKIPFKRLCHVVKTPAVIWEACCAT